MDGVPADYYRRLREVEARHWWEVGMRRIALALLGDRLARPGLRLLDAGCGAGGFLRFVADREPRAALAGIDLSGEAIELARAVVPEAELAVAGLDSLPFPDGSFDVVVTQDVLQHVREDELASSVSELCRVLASDGALLVRTNGARHARRERADWRVYDVETLAAALEQGGFAVRRVTYANTLLSAWGTVRGRVPRAPTEDRHGIPRTSGRLASVVGAQLLAGEALLLGHSRLRLPFGHTLFALAVPRR